MFFDQPCLEYLLAKFLSVRNSCLRVVFLFKLNKGSRALAKNRYISQEKVSHSKFSNLGEKQKQADLTHIPFINFRETKG